MKTFGNYYWSTFTRPRATFEDLISDPHKLKFSYIAVLIPAILYTMVYVFLIFGGGHPFKPWLDIPLEVYYRYNVFFCAPSMFLGWILAAGLVQVLSHVISGKGSFEQALVVLGFGIGVASWATGLHDILTSFLGAIHVIDQRQYEIALNSPTIWRTLLWIQMIIYLLWFIVLFSIGIKTVYKVRYWQAVVLGIIAFLTYQLFFLIFNR